MAKQRDWDAEGARKRTQRAVEKAQNPDGPKEGELAKAQAERAEVLEQYLTPFDLLGGKIEKPRK